MKLRKIVIETKIDLLNIDDVLKEMKYQFRDIEFKGWLNSFKIISINNINYKLLLARNLNQIILKETNSKNIRIPNCPAKQVAYKKYNNILGGKIMNDEKSVKIVFKDIDMTLVNDIEKIINEKDNEKIEVLEID